jgi:hypothetical protein
MWLNRFVFCRASLAPSTNYQHLAEQLVDGKHLPISQYLMGSVYHLLHQVSSRLWEGKDVGHIGGPWWFLQYWLHLYSMKQIVFTDLPVRHSL